MLEIESESVIVLTSPNGSFSYKIFAILISSPGYFTSFCFKASSLYTGSSTLERIRTLISSPGAIKTFFPFLYKDMPNPIVPPIAAPPATV